MNLKIYLLKDLLSKISRKVSLRVRNDNIVYTVVE